MMELLIFVNTFSVLSDDSDVNVVMSSFNSSLRFTPQDVDKEIKLIPHLHVAGLDVRSVHLGLDVTLDGATIALD